MIDIRFRFCAPLMSHFEHRSFSRRLCLAMTCKYGVTHKTGNTQHISTTQRPEPRPQHAAKMCLIICLSKCTRGQTDRHRDVQSCWLQYIAPLPSIWRRRKGLSSQAWLHDQRGYRGRSDYLVCRLELRITHAQ